jgi:uncharacterized membrane protein YfcA
LFKSLKVSNTQISLGVVLIVVVGYLLYRFQFAPFGFLGVFGAIFANATGAGGGVVFIPAFQKLGLTELQSVATSFAIQCCGMTTGAYVWLRYARQRVVEEHDWRLVIPFLAVSIPGSIVGLWVVYGVGIAAPSSLPTLFAWFSIVLGAALFVTVFKKNLQHRVDLPSKKAELVDLMALFLISVFGGGITAWLSVGVGEFVAFYLILRGYRVTLSVTVAVVLSSATVWAGISHHIAIDAIEYNVLMFAGPGAIIGAVIARQLATYLPVMQLKLFFAGWVFIVGCVELVSY